MESRYIQLTYENIIIFNYQNFLLQNQTGAFGDFTGNGKVVWLSLFFVQELTNLMIK